MKNKLKKFSEYKTIECDLKDRIVESKLSDMKIGLDLTKLRSDEYVKEKTIEFLNEYK
jgi:hypothetical protein